MRRIIGVESWRSVRTILVFLLANYLRYSSEPRDRFTVNLTSKKGLALNAPGQVEHLKSARIGIAFCCPVRDILLNSAKFIPILVSIQLFNTR